MVPPGDNQQPRFRFRRRLLEFQHKMLSRTSLYRLMNKINSNSVSKDWKTTQPCIPPGSLNRVPASAGGKGWTVTSAGWQVTLCDPILHVSSSSGVATSVSELPYPCYLLTYLLTYLQRPSTVCLDSCKRWRDDSEARRKVSQASGISEW